MHGHGPQFQHLRNLRLRALVVDAVRGFFKNRGYLEVETPVRIPSLAPEANIDAVSSEGWYLQTSPELCMKRLLAAGHERIFQICRCFRKGERGARHLPEMTLLEWYAAGSTYLHLMDECEALMREVARKVSSGGDRIVYQGHELDLSAPFHRLPVTEAFHRHAALTMEEALRAGRFDECMGLEIEPRLGFGRPVFLFDYPASTAALSRLHPGNPLLAERFEMVACGLELCNGFTELTDATEQRERFAAERQARKDSGKADCPMPETFLAALPDMPDAAGNALGLDRLVMLFADAATIDEVVSFVPEAL
ncbi:MAG: EF-P lysine aminoacylase GenX [Desulfobacteraceae bacterium]|nr:EF-P lysine aminoacylase GenX [Desulfobacteraceae bacterium]